MKKRFVKILLIVGILSSIVSLLGFFGQSFWLLDVLSHFSYQYFVVLILCFGGAALLGFPKITWLLLPFIAINGYEVFSVYLPVENEPVTGQTLTIDCMNLLYTNDDYLAVANYIKDNDPDILILQEYTQEWEENLELDLAQFPYSKRIPRTDNFGMALFSKFEVDTIELISIGKADIPSILTRFKLQEMPVTLVTIHPLPPSDQFSFESRNQQYDKINEYIDKFGGAFIVVGDLNSSPYSAHFKKLVNEDELRDTRMGVGVLPSWPNYFPLMYIPLDHILISEELTYQDRRTGPNIGSDHMPMHIEIGVSTKK